MDEHMVTKSRRPSFTIDTGAGLKSCACFNIPHGPNPECEMCDGSGWREIAGVRPKEEYL